MARHQPLLHVGAGAHFLGAAEQDAHGTLPHLGEQGLLLAIGVGVAHAGDLLPWHAVLHQLGHDVVIHREAPGRRMDPEIGKDELRAPRRRRALPEGGDVGHQGVELGLGHVGGLGREQPGIERQLAAIRGDGQGVILPGFHLASADGLIALHQGVLERVLCLGHRAGDDRGFVALQAWAGQIEHGGGLHVGVAAEHLLELRQVDELGKAAARAQALAVRRDFQGLDHVAEGGGPGVEVGQAALL